MLKSFVGALAYAGKGRFEIAGAVENFGSPAIVAFDEDDERVIELADLLQSVADAADLVVAISQLRRIDLHHAGGDLLLAVAQGIPCRNLVGTLRQTRSLGND